MLQQIFIIFFIIISLVYSQNEEDYRLYEKTIPTHYDLTITPNFKRIENFENQDFTFKGEVSISIITNEIDRSTIRINQKRLTIENSTKLYEKDNSTNEIEIISHIENKITEIGILTLKESLKANITYILKFTYTGMMDDDMHGFYRSSYVRDEQTM